MSAHLTHESPTKFSGNPTEDQSDRCLSYRPIRSLQNGRIVAIEALGIPIEPQDAIKDGSASVAIEVLWRHIAQLTRWQLSSFRGIPMSIKLPCGCLGNPQLISELAATVDRLGLQRGLLNLGPIPSPIFDLNIIDILQPIRLLGFHTAADYPTNHSGNLDRLLLGIDFLEVDFSSAATQLSSEEMRERVMELLVQTRRIELPIVANGIRALADYEWLRATKGIDSAQGSFFWDAMTAETLLRMEVNFDKLFSKGWKVRGGKFIPNNPLYFRPFPF